MTLAEMSRDYEESARLLRQRLRLLRQMAVDTHDPEELWHIQRRIAVLTPMLTQMNELAELTAHYYERGYYRNAKYTLGRLRRAAAAPGSAAQAAAQSH